VGMPVPASPILFEGVRFALAVADDTDGAFDPTIGHHMETRGFNREDRTGRTVHTPISPDGDVTEAKVLKSIPLLDQAALDAVKQWRYTPTTLNGVAVPVIMTVTVNFTIDGAPAQPVALNGAPVQSDATPSSSLATEWKGAPLVRIGGAVAAPERVKYVPPVYPADAQQARVGGIVIIEAIIDESGNVAMTKLLKSVPMLDDAALSAVGQWKYTPTLLNGVAVPVLMTVTVNFSIQLK